MNINFTDKNTAVIDRDREPRIKITFCGAAENLTRRAKVEIVLAARAEYSTQVMRITDGKLIPSQIYNSDDSIGTEAEVMPKGPII